MTLKIRGLTLAVMALMTPPLPAPSRPSKRMQTFRPSWRTHSCSLTSSTCSLRSSASYSLRLSFGLALPSASTSRERRQGCGSCCLCAFAWGISFSPGGFQVPYCKQ